MTPETVMDMAHQGMLVAVVLAGPVLVATLTIGLLVSLFQAATQINEMTLSFIPKIAGVLIVLSVAGPFVTQQLMEYTTKILSDIPRIAAM